MKGDRVQLHVGLRVQSLQHLLVAATRYGLFGCEHHDNHHHHHHHAQHHMMIMDLIPGADINVGKLHILAILVFTAAAGGDGKELRYEQGGLLLPGTS